MTRIGFSISPLSSCLNVFRKKRAPEDKPNTLQPQKHIGKSVPRACAPPPNISENRPNRADLSNAIIKENSDPANQSAVDKNKILERREIQETITYIDAKIKDHQEQIQYLKDEIKAAKDALPVVPPHEYGDSFNDSLSERWQARENLRKCETELTKLRQELDSLEEPAVEQNSKDPSISATNSDNANFNKVDTNDVGSPPRQQSHQESSKGKAGPVLGKFGKLISRIFPEKFIENYMSVSFNIRYSSTKISILQKKIDDLIAMHIKLLKSEGDITTYLNRSEKMLKTSEELHKIALEKAIVQQWPKRKEMIDKIVSECSQLIPEVRPQEYPSDKEAKEYLNEIIKIVFNKMKTLEAQKSSIYNQIKHLSLGIAGE